MVKVVITQNNEIKKAINEAFNYFDLTDIVKNKITAVKVNDTWASKKDKTAVTQPDTLKSVLREVKKYGPKRLIVTGGSGAGETDKIFEIAGLMGVVIEENVHFFDHNRPPFDEIRLKYAPEKDVSGPQKSVMINSRILEYESLIVVSQLKVHETATVTLSLKNIAMSFPAADYYGHPRGAYLRPHHFFEDMHSFIAAMALRFPISLAVIVGHPAMIGAGPIGGQTFETGLCIVSEDAVAADVVGARLLGFNVSGVRHLYEAGKLGVGEIDISKMQFPALSLKQAVEIFSEKAYGKKINLEHP